MDWLRRNWPDLLIGVALVAVIAGIIATLISGGSFFPFNSGGGTSTGSQPSTPITGPTTPGASTPSTSTPGTAGTTVGGQQPTTTPSGAVATPPAGSTQSGTTDDGAQSSATTPTEPSGEGIAVLPPSGTGTTAAGASDAPATGASSSDVTALPPPGAAVPQTSTSAPAATTPVTPAAPATSTSAPSTAIAASASDDVASYRVSVGAFGNADNAQRLAQEFQSAGYPVLMGTQGNLTIVLLGPYATDAEARRVASQVAAGNFGVVDPTVYHFEPDDVTASPATTAPAASATQTAASTAAPAASATATGRYLQVGAYANRESSLPQRQRLEGMGFTVTEVQEGTLLKLLVGPYQGTALSDAQSPLAAEGIENFARGL